MRIRFGDGPRPRWDVGILCFRGETGCEALARRLGARPVADKTFYGVREPGPDADVHEAVVAGRRVVLVFRCLWGGPQAAILVEEMACLGVPIVLGFGVAGSLVPELPKGTQLYAPAGLVTDGTSRAYTARGEVPADPGLSGALTIVARDLGIEVHPAPIATVDAIYRETADDVRRWLALGARAVNMETTPLYAAAAACEVRSLWLGHMSDSLSLETSAWESWVRPATMTEVSVSLIGGLVETITPPRARTSPEVG
jgi:uridine phosphorylase